MERLPLPDFVTAKQQITQLPNGEFARDRLMVVQKTDIIPIADPVVRDFIAKQEGRQMVQDAANNMFGEAALIMFLGQVVLMPLLLFLLLWMTN
jgi:hypothetical protein